VDLPILEYDPDPDDLIRNGLKVALAGRTLPSIGVVTFLGDVSRRWAADQGFQIASPVDLVTSVYPIWTGTYGGVELAIAELPVGAPAAVLIVEQMFLLGVDRMVAVGSCGALVHVDLVPLPAARSLGRDGCRCTGRVPSGSRSARPQGHRLRHLDDRRVLP
jgi:hypothetical protein